jgi:hypothetical protein
MHPRPDGPGRSVTWLICGTRGCSYCIVIRAHREAARHVDLFKLAGRPWYVVHTDSRRAVNLMDYARKLGQPAVRIPQDNGQVFVITTQHRKDAEVLDQETLVGIFLAVPAYSIKAGDTQVRVSWNMPMRALAKTAQMTTDEVEPTEDTQSGGGHGVHGAAEHPHKALRFAEERDFPVTRNDRDKVTLVDFTGVDPLLVIEFEGIESGLSAEEIAGLQHLRQEADARDRKAQAAQRRSAALAAEREAQAASWAETMVVVSQTFAYGRDLWAGDTDHWTFAA